MTALPHLTALLVLLAFATACQGPSEPASAPQPNPAVQARPEPLPTAVLPDRTKITLELALSHDEIARGLMYRPSLAADRGMLFVFEESRYPSFYMLNTLISLDIIFLDEGGFVIHVQPNAQPCPAEPCPRFSPESPAAAVLELSAGSAELHGIRAGSRIKVGNVGSYPRPASSGDASPGT